MAPNHAGCNDIVFYLHGENTLEYCLLVNMPSNPPGPHEQPEFLIPAEPDLWNSSGYAFLFFLLGD